MRRQIIYLCVYSTFKGINLNMFHLVCIYTVPCIHSAIQHSRVEHSIVHARPFDYYQNIWKWPTKSNYMIDINLIQNVNFIVNIQSRIVGIFGIFLVLFSFYSQFFLKNFWFSWFIHLRFCWEHWHCHWKLGYMSQWMK